MGSNDGGLAVAQRVSEGLSQVSSRWELHVGARRDVWAGFVTARLVLQCKPDRSPTSNTTPTFQQFHKESFVKINQEKSKGMNDFGKEKMRSTEPKDPDQEIVGLFSGVI